MTAAFASWWRTLHSARQRDLKCGERRSGRVNPFGVPEMTPSGVKGRLDKGEPLLMLDIREYDEVATASIEGAVHIPMGELGQRLDELPKDKDVVVFCHTGARSLMVSHQLRRRGYTRVFQMPGGIDLWSQQVDPSVPRYD